MGNGLGTYLSSENKRQLWVPKGFAHGFYVTSDTAEFVYKCTDYYNSGSRGVHKSGMTRYSIFNGL